jgi:hypothetical protein
MSISIFMINLRIDGLVKSPEFVMPVPDQVRDDGSGIQNILKSLDSGLAVIPDPEPGRNDALKEFQTFYEIVKLHHSIFKIPILVFHRRWKSKIEALRQRPTCGFVNTIF